MEGIYPTVFPCDILHRNHQADQNMLNNIMLFLCYNIGSITSLDSIGNILSNKGEECCWKNVDKYISMIRSAFIFYLVDRIIDMGFHNMLRGYQDADRGHMIENIVFLELIRKDYWVYIGKAGGTEVDFVAEKPNKSSIFR